MRIKLVSRKRKGFSGMTPAQHLEACSMGGKTAHRLGRLHKFTKEQTSAGGRATAASGKGHKFTPEEAKLAGRLGGLARAAQRRTALAPPAPR